MLTFEVAAMQSDVSSMRQDLDEFRRYVETRMDRVDANIITINERLFGLERSSNP